MAKPGHRPDTEPTEIDKRRALVGNMYANSRTMQSIADELEVSVTTICKDVAAITQQWRDSAVKDIGSRRARELAVLEETAQKAEKEWHLSKKGSTKVKKTTGGKDAGKIESWAETQCGDPRYLATIVDCSAKRCKILGLDAPIELNTATEYRVAGKTPEQVRAEVITTLSGLLADQSKQQPEGE